MLVMENGVLPLWFYDLGMDISEFEQRLKDSGIDMIMDINSPKVIQSIEKRIDILSKILEKPELSKNIAGTQRDIQQHIFLRILCSANDFCKRWFVNHESYLLKERFLSIPTFRKKMDVLETIMGDDIVPIVDFLKMKLIVDKDYIYNIATRNYTIQKKDKSGGLVAVKWYYVPKVVSKRSGDLIKGWCVTTIDSLYRFLIQMFKDHLEKRIDEIKESAEVTDPEMLALVERIEQDIRKKSGLILTLEDTEKLLVLFPLCIVKLIDFMKGGQDLSYMECLQLGLFLKGAGLTDRDYKMFWYYYNPRNKGMEYENFLGDWGYHADHLYGKEGSMVDYTSMSCFKCRSQGFCPFHSGYRKELGGILRDMYEDTMPKDELERKIRAIRTKMKKSPNIACTIEFKMRFKLKGKIKVISDPVKSYYRRAIDISGVKKERESEQKEKEKKL
jgi:DNA primase large subunit